MVVVESQTGGQGNIACKKFLLFCFMTRIIKALALPAYRCYKMCLCMWYKNEQISQEIRFSSVMYTAAMCGSNTF